MNFLVDRVLESENFIQLIKEATFKIQNFNDFVVEIRKFNDRLQKQKVETDLKVEEPTLYWKVDYPYLSNPVQELYVNNFTPPATVDCDKSYKFSAPGSANLNSLSSAIQILEMIDNFIYKLEKDNPDNKKKDSDEDEEEKFDLDPSLVRIMDKLKAEGESLLNRAKAIPPLEINGKKYKVKDGKLYVSTEREGVVSLLFDRELENDIYDSSKAGQQLRAALLKHFNRNGFRGKESPEFRIDMNKDPYFYIGFGKIPVKNATGPEAKALLNYFDGNKVRFQPRSND